MEIFKLFGTILINSAEAEKSIAKTGKDSEGLTTKLGNGIKTAAKWGAALVAGAAAVGAAMFGAATKVAEATDAVDKASRRAGTDVETWQKLTYAMSQSGISAESLERSMVKNQQALSKVADGNKTAIAAYEELGVAVYDLDGQMRDSDAVFQDALNSLADMEDINKRNALANTLFGKSYADLAPILDEGSDGIAELTSRAEKLGLVMSQDAVDAGLVFGDTLDDVKQMFGQLGLVIAGQFLPLLQRGLDFIIDNAPLLIETAQGIADKVTEAIAWITDFWDKHGEKIRKITEQVFSVIQFIIEKAMNIIRGIIDLVMGIIRGDWERAWNGLKNIASNVFDLLKNAAKLALDAIAAIIRGAANILWNAGRSAFMGVWDGMQSVWSSISNWVSEKVSWLADKLTFWRSSSSEMSSTSIDGSHAGGLPYVPYDGYIAELHRGERVLTADQNAQLSGGAVVYNRFYLENVEIRSEEDIERLAEEFARREQQGYRELGVVKA